MKVPYRTIPVLIVVTTVAALMSTRLFAIPTLTIEYGDAENAPPADAATVSMVVKGVKCTDTAETAAGNLEDTDGILKFVAYASYNRVDVTYVPREISTQEIRELLEDPVYLEETGEFMYNVYKVLEIDGQKTTER